MTHLNNFVDARKLERTDLKLLGDIIQGEDIKDFSKSILGYDATPQDLVDTFLPPFMFEGGGGLLASDVLSLGGEVNLEGFNGKKLASLSGGDSNTPQHTRDTNVLGNKKERLATSVGFSKAINQGTIKGVNIDYLTLVCTTRNYDKTKPMVIKENIEKLDDDGYVIGHELKEISQYGELKLFELHNLIFRLCPCYSDVEALMQTKFKIAQGYMSVHPDANEEHYKHKFSLESKGFELRFNLKINSRREIIIQDLYLVLTGAYWSLFELEHTHEILRDLAYVYNFKKCNRIDLKFDDYGQRAPVKYLLPAIKNGNLLNQKKIQPLLDRNGKKCYDENGELILDIKNYKYFQSQGTTHYLGYDKKILRFYNTLLKHGFNAQRTELQVREQYAQNTFDILIGTELEDMKTKILEIILGAYEFKYYVNYPSWKPKCKAPMMQWWAEWINYVKGNLEVIKIKIKRHKTTLEKKARWLLQSGNQVIKTLLIFWLGFGSEYFNQILEIVALRNSDKFTAKDMAMIEILETVDKDDLQILPFQHVSLFYT